MSEDLSTAPMDDESPADVSDDSDSNVPGSAPADEPIVPGSNPEQPEPQQEAVDSAGPAQAQPTQAPAMTLVGGPVPPTAQDLSNESAATADDMAKGHINPMHYKDMLFPPEQGTLGKIGTILGLMVGSAGAGLSHQPNILLGMMDKEIQNNLESQKANASNKQNWYKLRLEHEMQNANMQKMSYENAATAAKTSMLPKEAALLDAQVRNAHAMTDKISNEVTGIKTHNDIQRAALNESGLLIDNMPPGPQKDKATQVFTQTVMPAAAQQEAQRNAQGAAKVGLLRAMAPYPALPAAPQGTGASGDWGSAPEQPQAQQEPASGSQEPVNYKKLKALKMAEGLNFDGAKADDEARQVDETEKMRSMYVDAFDKLNRMPLGGAISPEKRAAIIGPLLAKMATATTHRFNTAEAATQADAMFPSMKDGGLGDPSSTRATKLAQGLNFFNLEDGATPVLKQYGLRNNPHEEGLNQVQYGLDKKDPQTPYMYSHAKKKWLKVK